MVWISRLRASGEGERANPWDETVINGTPSETHKAIQGSLENPAAAGDRPMSTSLPVVEKKEESQNG
jgi:hypothetical protein